MPRRRTSTSAFGASKRESHDASGFYRRFAPPILTEDESIAPHSPLDKMIVGDSRRMEEVPDSSVALVVTSPPYFAGKEYEQSLGEAGVPATYFDYLSLLRDVFAECVRKLEPGGRIAVNVANLGRRPYRSLSADVTAILQDDLRLLLRGEIIWQKQRGSSGSCAWGSFQKARNPVLRDLTERVIVASKGRFDRAVPPAVRARQGLPWQSSMTRDDFMENTLDVWQIPAASATRVGHPAPFPIELPARLIGLYTYRDDLVLDPFAGSGTAAVAAVRSGRHYVGYDLDESYIALAEARLAGERRLIAAALEKPTDASLTAAISSSTAVDLDPLAVAIREGRSAREIARLLIERAGFTDLRPDRRCSGGVAVDYTATDAGGRRWLFEVAGSFISYRSGPATSEGLWKAIGKAAVLAQGGEVPLVLLTTGALANRSAVADALGHLSGPGRPVTAVIDMLALSAAEELKALSSRR